MELGKYSIGIGDRFAHQGKAQLAAIQKAGQAGVHITPGKPSLYWAHIFSSEERLGSWGQAGISLRYSLICEQAASASVWGMVPIIVGKQLNSVSVMISSATFFG